ncbi:GNVR domain-containing protein, partial [Klebsiella pneumoniae]|uniref:GNVR domain-containing protein n=1 Tax=Klebsiella pneumoniae TaxID=573 RepID=UPI00272E8EF7
FRRQLYLWLGSGLLVLLALLWLGLTWGLRTLKRVSAELDQVEAGQRERLSDDHPRELLRLTRDVEVSSETYSMLLNKTQELDIIRAGTVGNVRIIDHAAADLENPVKPNKPLVVIVATLLGALLATAFVYVREALKRGVENPEDIERTGTPVYASIPFTDKQAALEKRLANFKRDKSTASYLLTINDPADLATEAMRSLRTSLHFAMIEAKNNVLMIT